MPYLALARRQAVQPFRRRAGPPPPPAQQRRRARCRHPAHGMKYQMSDIFHMSHGDTLWALDLSLADTAFDLTGASVNFTLATEAGVALFTRPATVQIAPITPCLRHLWQTGDMAVEGYVKGWFRVTWPFGTKHCPTPGSIVIACRRARRGRLRSGQKRG